MDLGLKDKIAMVTGAGSQIGFGRETALTLAREGCDVIIVDMYLEGSEKTAAEIKKLGRRTTVYQVDISSYDDVSRMMEKALTEFGRIDILVNCAGIAGGGGGFFANSDPAKWTRTIDVNLYGTMNTTRAVLPHMLDNGYGKIINFTSGLAKSGGPGTAVYSASKGGVISFTKSIAAEVAGRGINVNCVSPGLAPGTNFGGAPDGPAKDPNAPVSERSQSVLETIPLGRFTEPRDIAPMVAYLASDLAGDIVGQPISVEGGRFMM